MLPLNKGSQEDSQSSAEIVTSCIDKVETVADDLFSEWLQEMKKYSSDKLRRYSQKKFNDTNGSIHHC
jgi:hypothetical protein